MCVCVCVYCILPLSLSQLWVGQFHVTVNPRVNFSWVQFVGIIVKINPCRLSGGKIIPKYHVVVGNIADCAIPP